MIDLVSNLQFWIALGQIIAVNLALSGNNGMVIALAAHSLPSRQRRRAIFWGSLGAIALRVVLTVVAFEVLRLPYMKIVGGVLLLWIAVQLLILDTREDQPRAGRDSIFASAGYIILLANLAMSLDNVLAIAAAAADNRAILAIGLAISIMAIGFGGTWVMKVTSGFPVIYTLCAALIGYLAGDMLVGDWVLKDWVHDHLHWLQSVTLGHVEVSVSGLAGTASVFPLARLYDVLRRRHRGGTAGSQSVPLIRLLRNGVEFAGAKLSASRIFALLPFAVVVTVTFLGHPLYVHYQQRLFSQISYYDLKLGMTPEEVISIKGRPAYVFGKSENGGGQVPIKLEAIPKGKTARDYAEWGYPVGKTEPGSLEITFSGKTMRVAEIGCYSQTGYCLPVSGISTGASEDEIMEKLGAPRDVQLKNGSRTFNYPDLHLSLLLEKKRVSLLSVHQFDSAAPRQNKN